MSVSRAGEFGLIDRLAEVLGQPTQSALLLGIGDDAAAWRPAPGTTTVATADALVEGVHFDLTTTGWCDLGWKALAENVSDVAAMGCTPRYAIVTLALPPDTETNDIEDLYRGMKECADAYGCAVIGGDVVASPAINISVFLTGESSASEEGETPPLLTRSAARPGDVIAVTGPLGGSAGGLRVLSERGVTADSIRGHALASVHRRPTPRVAAGRALLQAGVRCAIDVSDGLMADVGHICERSGVDAAIDVASVPVNRDVAALFPEAAVELALSGGEDYELACAAPPETLRRANEILRTAGEPELTIVGEIVERRGAHPEVILHDGRGKRVELSRTGYQHFTTSAMGQRDG